jgi:lipopolysaccharide/colanic/teichoic acid biosynthesis glycosyltransferase
MEKPLILLRERYNANDICPGLTGWAQIDGRDEVDTNKKLF